jgi:Flp pilus assembly protein TadG
MIRKFLSDRRGNYMLLTAVAIVPIMGALALAIDYGNMSRQRQETLNALDAAGVATARYIASGATDEQAIQYAHDFFEANLGTANPADATLSVLLPKENMGGATLKLTANMTYHPYFFPAFAKLIGKTSDNTNLAFNASSEVRLKNTLEVALVLDNSGSMDFYGSDSGKKRLALLKDAAKQLVDTLAEQGEQLKQLPNPVQFGVVPFAASVNVGPSHANDSWMDRDGISPVHHENFNWTTMTGDKRVELIGGVYYKKGTGWGSEENQKVTRFTLFNDIKFTQRQCTGSGWNRTCENVIVPYASWEGCVEARPDPYDTTDETPSSSKPASLFVPMFSPDEAGNVWTKQDDGRVKRFSAYNSWWDDLNTSTSTSTSNQYARQAAMTKYFVVAPQGAVDAAGAHSGPNGSCTTTPITPLTDVTTLAGKTAIKDAIDDMKAEGATNVPEGMAWGWRVVSSGVPFTEGRPDYEKGNDKVVIVLTDGANTYYTLDYFGSTTDYAGNKSSYAAYGYAGKGYNGTTTSRIFKGTTASASTYTMDNYSAAMNQHFAKLCDNVKDNAGGTRQDKVMVITVALDLNTSNAVEKAQYDALKACASYSRFSRDEDDTTKPKKLFWNTTGGKLEDTFKKIADELSNLRIVS